MRGEASASERRSVPKQQTGSGGYRFVGSSGLSPRKICIGYRTGLYLSRKSQVHAGRFRGPYSTSPALSCTLQPFSTNPIHSSPHTISLPSKGLPLPLGNFHCSHEVFPLQCLFGPFSKSLSAPPSRHFWLAPHVHPLSLHSSRMAACFATSDIPSGNFNPIHIAVCIVFLRTTHLCPLVSFPFSLASLSRPPHGRLYYRPTGDRQGLVLNSDGRCDLFGIGQSGHHVAEVRASAFGVE